VVCDYNCSDHIGIDLSGHLATGCYQIDQGSVNTGPIAWERLKHPEKKVNSFFSDNTVQALIISKYFPETVYSFYISCSHVSCGSQPKVTSDLLLSVATAGTS
jgi:hypothetical protein